MLWATSSSIIDLSSINITFWDDQNDYSLLNNEN